MSINTFIAVRFLKTRRRKAVCVFRVQKQMLENTSQMTTSSVSGVRHNWKIGGGGGGATWRKNTRSPFRRNMQNTSKDAETAETVSRPRERRRDIRKHAVPRVCR